MDKKKIRNTEMSDSGKNWNIVTGCTPYSDGCLNCYAMPDLDLDGIDWVVVGGETNKAGNFRPMEKQWIIDLRNQVKGAGLPFMFKHWPGRSHNATEALLEGHRWDEYPPTLLRNMGW